MELLETAGNLLDSLTHGPLWLFVACFCVLFTQGLRYLKFFPNWLIPFAVVPGGTASYYLLCDMSQFGVRNPWLKAVMAGIMLSTVAWAASGSIMGYVFLKARHYLPQECLPADVQVKEAKQENDKQTKNET